MTQNPHPQRLTGTPRREDRTDLSRYAEAKQLSEGNGARWRQRELPEAGFPSNARERSDSGRQQRQHPRLRERDPQRPCVELPPPHDRTESQRRCTDKVQHKALPAWTVGPLLEDECLSNETVTGDP